MPQTAPPAKPAPDFRHGPQGLRRNELDLGRAVDVDELDQQIGDSVVFQSVCELAECVVEMRHAVSSPFFGTNEGIRFSATTRSHARADCGGNPFGTLATHGRIDWRLAHNESGPPSRRTCSYAIRRSS